MKLAGIILTVVILILGGVIISGQPGGCSGGINQYRERKLVEVEQEINLFLAGEKNQLTVSDREVEALIKGRLTLPKEVSRMDICFGENGGIASGSLKILGKNIDWIVGGGVRFDQVNPRVIIDRVEIGGSGKIPGLNWWLKAKIEKRLNQRMMGIFVGYPYRVIWEEGQVNLERI